MQTLFLVKTLPGEKVKVMHIFLRAKLAEKHRSGVIIHGGTNNICNIDGGVSSQSGEDIVEELICMGIHVDSLV